MFYNYLETCWHIMGENMAPPPPHPLAKYLPVYHPRDIIHSNAQVLNEKKAKEITGVKEVWMFDPNYHQVCHVVFLPEFLMLKNYINAQDCYITYPNISN